MFEQIGMGATRLSCVQAYCLYRLGKLQAALAALGEVPVDKEVARLQLEARVGFRVPGSRLAML
jgi:hypothetical protein